MDARCPEFLAPHVDFAACTFDVSGSDGVLEAVLGGQLLDTSVPCSFILRGPCNERGELDVRVQGHFSLEMRIPELAGLALDLSKLDRAKPRSLADLWIDNAIADAWNDLTEEDHLVLDDGHCVITATIHANDLIHSERLVALARAMADAPSRRADEIVEAFAQFSPVVEPRLVLDTEVARMRHRGMDLAIRITRDVHTQFVVEGRPALTLDGFTLDANAIDQACELAGAAPLAPYR